MAQKKNFEEIVMEKKATLEIVEDLMERLGRLEEDARKDWGVVGTKQRTKWSDEQGKSLPVYLDECGNETFDVTDTPKIVDDYDYFEKKEFTPQDKAKLASIDAIREILANLV